MSTTIILNCWVLGGDATRIFSVEIRENRTVGDLQDAIKLKKTPVFDYMAANSFDLWKVSIPIDADEDFEEKVSNLKLDDTKRLMPVKRLSEVFTDLVEKSLHVVVKVPSPSRSLTQISDVPQLRLNCWVLGDDATRIFSVEIRENRTVGDLRDAIKLKKTPVFDYMAANSFDLWKVSIPIDADEDFEEKVSNLKLDDTKRLIPVKRLSEVFTDLVEENLHVVVKVPSPKTLTLNCLVLGNDVTKIFIIRISSDMYVTDLKKEIRIELSPAFDRISSNDLTLWNVSIPIDRHINENLRQHFPDEALIGSQRLSDLFSNGIPAGCLHIVVEPPPDRRTSRIAPTSYTISANTDGLEARRSKFLDKSPSKSPSEQGKSGVFRLRQRVSTKAIACNRPFSASDAIPVTLLHRVFGEFVANCENYEPTKRDNDVVWELTVAMSEIYESENDRRDKVQDILEEYGLHLERSKVGRTNFETDDDFTSGKYPVALAEFKNEVGSTGAEPYFQAALYYLEMTRKVAPKLLSSALPCLIILVFGPYLCFAGAAWNTRPNLQVLSPAVPFHFHSSDSRFRRMAARHLGACAIAFKQIKEYYDQDEFHHAVPTGPAFTSRPQPNQLFPYPTTFTSLVDSKERRFAYLSHMDPRSLVFHGKSSEGGDDICIKFVRQYSKEVHEFCASIEAAPKLLGFESLPGGWYMVVMAFVGEEYVELHRSSPSSVVTERIQEIVNKLHQRGYVHGDIRDTNVMVSSSSSTAGSPVFLLDFDWAGNIGQVRYPMNTHYGPDLWRPEGARDGMLIMAEHDIQMMEFMLWSQ